MLLDVDEECSEVSPETAGFLFSDIAATLRFMQYLHDYHQGHAVRHQTTFYHRVGDDILEH
jgi:hypothetical protein